MVIKPKRLQKGDTLAIVAPSWGGASIFPHIYESGIETLKKLGFKIKEFPSVKSSNEFNYNNPKSRAKDINDAFADRDIKGIITTIGGEDSVRILPYLDKNKIKNNPKFFMGYSDTTTLNTFFNQLGLVSFNGPSIMAGFSQWDSMPKEFKEDIEEFIFNPKQNYNYKQYKTYYEGYPGWSEKKNVGKLKKENKASGWNWLQGKTKVRGELFGGCFAVLEMFKGTEFWPKKDFWEGKILFLETSEGKPPADQVKYWLRNYGMLGVFDKISALLIGRARDYSKDEKKELDKYILKVVKEEFGNKNLPIVTNMDFGHTDPQIILPLGIKAEIDCINKKFRLIEKAFED